MQITVPESFKKYHQFINWMVVNETKVPVNKYGRIDAHDPANFLSYEQACETGYPVGFVFTPDDPFVFIDYDNVYNLTTGWNIIAQDAFRRFQGAFFEVSHSGRGLHIFASARLSQDYKTRSQGFPGEIYTDSRFVALTGYHATGDAAVDVSGILEPYMQHFGFQVSDGTDKPAVEYIEQTDTAYTGPENDDDLLKAMEQSKGGAGVIMGDKCHVWELFTAYERKLRTCFPASGRADGCTYDRSAADAALFGHLAYWTGKNPARMIRLFKKSALFRPKHTRSGEYHLRKSVALAINTCGKVYDLKQDTDKSGLRADVHMSITDQIEYFTQCVYIREADKILTPTGELLKPTVFNATYGGYEFQMEPSNAKPTRKAFEAFTENRGYKFPKVGRLYFDPKDAPGHIKNDAVNTWIPPVIDTLVGDASPFIDHIRKILPNHTDAEILLTWMQCVTRYPGYKAGWSPVIQGTEGNGKTFLASVLENAVGAEYTHTPRPQHVVREQNAWILNKLLVVVEEIRIADKREILDVLKPMITNYKTEIRDMQKSAVTRENYVKLLFFTNFKDAIPVNLDSRRYCIFYTAQQSKNDMIRDGMINPDGETSDYFKQLWDWLHNHNGYAITADFLLNQPIVMPVFDPVFKCIIAPQTSSTVEAIEESYTGFQQDILDAINTLDDRTFTIDGVTHGKIYQGCEGFRNGWIDTAYLETVTDYKINTSTINTQLKLLGYKKIGRATRPTFNSKKGRLYYKGSKIFTDHYMSVYLEDQQS